MGIKKDKRATISSKMILSIPRLIFLLIVFLSVSLLIRMFVVTEINVEGVESQIFANRIMYSRDGFMYFDDEINRVYPGIVDLERFTDANIEKKLNNSINYMPENKWIAAKISLKESNQIFKKADGSEVASIYYNGLWYNRWKPRTVVSAGSGGAKYFPVTFSVLVKEKEELRSAVLELEIIMPN